MKKELLNEHEIDFVHEDRRDYKPSLHTHQRYEVFYLHSGTITFLIGSNVYILQPGDILLTNGMTLHRPKVTPGKRYVRSVIHFEQEAIKPFLQMLHSENILLPFEEENHFRISLSDPNKAEMESLLKRMASYKRDNLIGYNRFKLSFVDLLYFVLELYQLVKETNSEKNVSNQQEENVQQVISYLDKNYMEEITMEVLQAELHINKSYLSKLFKKVTGTTIFNYLYELRIKKAKMLFLMDKEITVTEVAFQVGFKHLSHFSRLFKQHTGVSPEMFKKTYGE